MQTFDPGTVLQLVAPGLCAGLAGSIVMARVIRETGVSRSAAWVATQDRENGIVFRFQGRTLDRATPAALAWIGAPVPDGQDLRALGERLGRACPDFEARFEKLLRDGTPFSGSGQEMGRRVTVSGRPHRGRTRVEVTETALSDELAQVNAATHRADMADLARLRGVLAEAPFLIWEEADDGTIPWHNAAYERVAAEARSDHDPCRWPGPRLFASDTSTGAGEDGPVRAAIRLPEDRGVWWFETYARTDAHGHRLRFALHADPVVKAEVALRNFVQTLTKTFAHLPIGLAVFNRDRRLSIFNPALADLTTLEPEWMGSRPTIGAFFDRLRERRMIPEPRDYQRWRGRMADLIRAAEDGTFEENWPLPGGQTFRVAGRPHPDGAVAFLFEDITAEVSLKRQFRAELAAAQAALDAQDVAVCVFSGPGTLALTNAAFTRWFGFAADETMTEIVARDATARMAACARASPFWGDLRSFIAGDTDRSAWDDRIAMNQGSVLAVDVMPLAGGFTLCRFDTVDNLPKNAMPHAPAHADEKAAG